MSRRKKPAADSSDDGKAQIGIFAHKVHRFKKKGGPSSDSGSDLASDSSDDDLSDAPSTRKRGRPAKKGASSVVQKKRADPLLLDGEDDEEEIEVVPQKPSLKAKAPLKKAKATEKASTSSSFRTLRVLDDEAYMAKLPEAPAVEKDEALERLKEEQQRTRESRMALQQAHAMSVNIDAELLANAVAVPGMQEREKVVVVLQKDPNPQGTIQKYRIYKGDPIRIRLLKTYATTIKADLQDMVFFFGDKEVTTHDTAKTLGIADGGVIVWRSKTELAEAAAKSAAASKGKTITLKMRFDQKSEITIKVGESDTFEKIQAQLAKAIEAQPSDLRLTLDGGTLDPDSTPKNEDLEDEDIIEVETVGE